MPARVRAFLRTFGFWLGYFWVARAIFLGYHGGAARALPAGDLLGGYAHGLRLDLSAAAYLTAIPAVLLILSTIRPFLRAVPALLAIWMGIAVIGCSFLIAADLELYTQWDRRIDGAVIPYLRTPAEAWASTGASPRWLLGAIAIGLAAAALLAFRKLVAREWRTLPPVNPLWSIPAVLFLGILVIPARGGIQEIALTQSSGYFSSRSFANAAALNAAWGFFDSVARGGDDRTNRYRTTDPKDAEATVAAATAPLGPRSPSPLGTDRPNILLIVWESASADAFGSLGGEPGVTAAFDSLAREGILFRRFFAAGDRTDKGVAAVLSGFPALPKGSILKVPTKAASLPKLPSDLARAGYRTAFYYGGELEFASLKAYLIEAGFDRVVGKGDFPRASWNSKWGAHDGVVADRLLGDLDSIRTPFFATWLTLSSHEPFETPVATRIEGADWRSRYLNSMAYTDQVIGDLIRKARTRPWWKNTLVVIVADHGRRVTLDDAQSPPRGGERLFHIPMLWLGGAVTARDSVTDRLGSQLDIAPTLLELAGVAPAQPYRWGRSLLQPTAHPHAYYGFEVGFGLITDHGSLVYDDRAGRITTRTGSTTESDERLGRALLQLTVQDYLDR